MTLTHEPFQRHYPFEDIHNFRDLGGYPTDSGGRTRHGVVFRSATVHRATSTDRARLESLGIGYVFDLRSYRELDRDGHAEFDDIGIVREHAPVFPDTDASPDALIERYQMYNEDFAIAYLHMLERGAGAFRYVIERIAEADRAVVYHCTGGKDRAGMLSALLLSVAGVPRAHIVEDYALTAELLPRPDEERIAQFVEQYGLTREHYLRLHRADPDAMERTLARIDAEYGGPVAYLSGAGVSDETLAAVRERLVDLEEGDSA